MAPLACVLCLKAEAWARDAAGTGALVPLCVQVWSGSRDRTIVAHDATSMTALFTLGDQVRTPAPRHA